MAADSGTHKQRLHVQQPLQPNHIQIQDQIQIHNQIHIPIHNQRRTLQGLIQTQAAGAVCFFREKHTLYTSYTVRQQLGLDQDQDRTRTGPRQDQDRTKTRPRQDQDRTKKS
ncbi:uncharacterized protein V6R79_020693 [Siganus canaliculatus]